MNMFQQYTHKYYYNSLSSITSYKGTYANIVGYYSDDSCILYSLHMRVGYFNRTFTFSLSSGKVEGRIIGTPETDSFFFQLFPVSLMSLEASRSERLSVSFLGKPILSLSLKSDTGAERTILTRERCFITLPALFLEINSLTDHVNCIYLILENNRIAFDYDYDVRPQWEPRLNVEIPGLHTLKLNIPLHPSDEVYENISLSSVSQRIPIWYATRDAKGIVSGSEASKYSAGFWMDKEEEKETLRKISLQRYGRLKEPEATMVVIYNFPTCSFYECGTFRKGHKKASPDLLCVNRETGKKSVFELKASYFTVKFPDYYVPQLYWEMAATNTREATLVRYQSKRAVTEENKWAKYRKAMSYTIQWDPELAQALDANVSLVFKHPEWSLAEVVKHYSDNFKRVREMCKALAEKTLGRELAIPTDDLDAFEKTRWILLKENSHGGGDI